MAESRDPAELADLWAGWRRIAPPMRDPLHALRRADQQGRARARIRGHRRDVAVELRHAARRVLRRSRAPVAAGPAVLRVAARLRAPPSGRAVRRRGGAAGRPDSRRTCSGTLGPGVGQHLRSRGARRRDARVRRHRAAARAEDGRARHRPNGRGLLQVARVRSAAGDVLGALALHQARRSRCRLPRERMGHRQPRATCA